MRKKHTWLKDALEKVAKEQLEKSKKLEPKVKETKPTVNVANLDMPKWEAIDDR